MHLDYRHHEIGQSTIILADCFEWLKRIPENTLHAIVTDPPYGVKEYEEDQLEKRASGRGGIWRIPPSFDNNLRAPLPRFTALNEKERQNLYSFFAEWSKLCSRALRPGAHVFIATNSFVAQLLYAALVEGGLEFRGQIIRIVRTLRGGDRPKNAEKEFPNVSSLPRGCFEPWGLFRKPIPPRMKVSECLREFQTGGLRRISEDRPFEDAIVSERTPRKERDIADHPSLKPQSFMRQILFAALPLGVGMATDTFMGSGSTIAAAEALGIQSFGVEKSAEYFEMAKEAIPKLRDISIPEIDKMLGRKKGQQTIFFQRTMTGGKSS